MAVGLVVLAFLAAVSNPVDAAWSYAEQGADWPEQFPACGGEVQTPIDIRTDDVIDFTEPHPIRFSENIHKKVENATLENNGYGYKIEFHDKNRFMWSSGLPGSPYTLLQVHIHFGSKEGYGSEHTLNGVHYPAEIHFVFQSKILEGSEMGHLAVLGFFINTYDDVSAAGRGITVWLDKLSEVPDEGDKADMDNLIDISTIIPLKTKWKMSRYFRYQGSLTTPPCSEIVQWTVFQDPIYISSEQYKKLLKGKRKSGRAMLNTYRPPMPLNGRTVYRSNYQDADF